MFQAPDIIAYASRQPLMVDELEILSEKDMQIPGSVQYTIRRFKKHSQRNVEDTGMMVYHYKKENPKENYLELRFCISGNVYCNQKKSECIECRVTTSKNCSEQIQSLDVLSFRFSTIHLSQFVQPGRVSEMFADEIFHFKHRSSFTKILPLCGRTRMVLEG